MQWKTEYYRMYKILKEIRTQGISTYRLLSYCGIPHSIGVVMLQKLVKLGFIESFTEGRAIIWRCTAKGVKLLSEMIGILHRLDIP